MNRSRFGLISLLLFIFFTTVICVGQGEGLIIEKVDTSAFPDVDLLFTITDDTVLETGDLTTDDFTLMENDVKISDFSIEPASVDKDSDIAIVLVIDRSGSVEKSYLTEMQNMAVEIINSLDDGDEAGLVIFNENIEVHELTEDKNSLVQKVNDIQLDGASALYEAIAKASKVLQNSSTHYKALIVFSDGEDHSSLSTYTKDILLNEIPGDGECPVFTIDTGQGDLVDILKELSSCTGGKFLGNLSSLASSSVMKSVLPSTDCLLKYRSPSKEKNIKLTVTALCNGQTLMAEETFDAPDSTVNVTAPADDTEETQVEPSAGKDKKGSGAAIYFTVIIIIVLAIFGIFYLLKQQKENERKLQEERKKKLEEDRKKSEEEKKKPPSSVIFPCWSRLKI